MNETAEPQKVLDWRLEDVKTHFGCSRDTVYRWMRRASKPLPHYRPGGGVPRFSSDEVKEWGFSE